MNINEILDQIERGLEGVTPGPWRRKPMKGYTDDYVLTDHPDFQQPKHGNFVAECGFSGGKVEHRYEADAAHIARCDPDTMRAIIDAYRQTEAENTRLRAALANSELPCVYCTLPKDEWSKCPYGFPGCGRANDAMGCPELGARMEAEEWRERALRAEAENKQAVEVMKMLLNWAGKRCPCENETPDPCPLCGAGVANLQPCMAAENTIPSDILRKARAALKAMETTDE